MTFRGKLNRQHLFENYRENPHLRSKFFSYTQTVFPGTNFEQWFKDGYWTEKYVPLSLVRKDTIVSNVSITEMNLLENDKSKKGIQIGTVGTIPEYRNQGLSRYLMEHVIHKYEPLCDIIFLYANESVLDYYPKFNFKPYKEVIYKSYTIPDSEYVARKLNVTNRNDRTIINSLLSNRRTLTRLFGATNYEFITQWHLLNAFTDDIYFVEEEKVILICREIGRELHILEVIFKDQIDLKTVISKVIINKNLNGIYYYFPPDQLRFEYDEVIEDKESHLFVRGNFDVGDKAFKFPVTAQT